MKWVVAFVVCTVLESSVAAPQSATNLRDDEDMFEDVFKEITSDDAKRVRREERTVMDILTGNLPRGLDDVDKRRDNVPRVTRSVGDPMLISPGPEPCGHDADPFSGSYQQQYFDPSVAPKSEPKTHKIPVLAVAGIGGHQESLLEPVHKDTVYYATIPFISGYKMTPIISNKKVVVKDLPGHGHGGLVGGGLGGHGGLLGGGHGGLIGGGHGGLIGGGLGGLVRDGLSPQLPGVGVTGLPGLGVPGLPGLSVPGLPGVPLGGLPGYLPSSRSSSPDFMPQPSYPFPPDLDYTSPQSRSSHPQDFYVADPSARHPLDLNIFFETPEAAAARDASPELLTPEAYVDAIRHLQQQMDHLQSLKLAQERLIQPEEINCV